ncbi:hypothetical protein PRIPAC_80977 [Pristionchus pacificus]|uniref:Uncharacterized protein n=1 Tax=Pristionchus pacificus TaxID=54126 RepID=A0A2A6CN50_PRIPA|nr:hypothetical protein PRIPAC_80977 [Pristionchus pacificus]|eukprot:PDM79526.1 hypothetical protein PRIPAC_32105 [Pristionchus pacificus]
MYHPSAPIDSRQNGGGGLPGVGSQLSTAIIRGPHQIRTVQATKVKVQLSIDKCQALTDVDAYRIPAFLAWGLSMGCIQPT